MTTELIQTALVEIAANRQRRAFDEGKLRELSDSIENEAIGLLHPIVLRREGQRYVLVAGERRLRAVKDSHELGVSVWHAQTQVPKGMIPFLDIGKMDPLDAWEAELEENIKRADLTWQERASATSQLLELRRAQAEQRGAPAPTIAAIATEVTGKSESGYHSRVREQIILAKHMDDPDVASATSVEKAMKVLRKKEEIKRNTALASEVGKISASDMHQIINADSAEWVKGVPDGSFDVILTDPPYGMGADEFGDSGGMAMGQHGYGDSPEVFTTILEWLPEQSFRIAKPMAHAYVFCDFEGYAALKTAMERAGWKVFRTPLIWHKPQGFRAPWPDMGPQRRYETFLFAVKGDKRTTKMGGDVISCPSDDNLGHAAQKPVALYVDILSRSVAPGDRVVDLFAGTGTIIPACHALKCRATAVEVDPSPYAIAIRRLKELS